MVVINYYYNRYENHWWGNKGSYFDVVEQNVYIFTRLNSAHATFSVSGMTCLQQHVQTLQVLIATFSDTNCPFNSALRSAAVVVVF